MVPSFWDTQKLKSNSEWVRPYKKHPSSFSELGLNFSDVEGAVPDPDKQAVLAAGLCRGRPLWVQSRVRGLMVQNVSVPFNYINPY